MKDKISIIIPVYNSSKYLKVCLDSVINNSYSNIEIIIIDDASIDNSLDIINSYHDSRIKLIKNKTNLGAGESRNIGINIASGEYITFIDSDDYIDYDYLEYLYNLINSYKCNIACVDIRSKNKKEIIKVIDNPINDLLTFKIDMGPVKLFKKELFKDIYFSNTKNYEDILFTSKMLLKQRIVISSLNKYHYRNNLNSLSNSNYYEYDRVINSLKLHELINSNYSLFYYYFNCLGYINKTIIDNIDYEFNKSIIISLKKDIKKIYKLDYKFIKKIQIFIFTYFNKIYIFLYKVFRKY